MGVNAINNVNIMFRPKPSERRENRTHQTSRCGVLENSRGFQHFHHKRTPVSEQVVLGANPREQSVYDPYRGPLCGNKRTGLCQYRDQCGLSKQSGLSGHVWTGDNVETRIRAEVDTVWSKDAPGC